MDAAGFRAALAGNTGGNAIAEFMGMLLTAPPDVHYEIGVMWAEPGGWCAYQRIGDKALRMSPREARRLATSFETMASKPEWYRQRDWALDYAKTFRDLAAECEQKNRDGAKPDGWQISQPAEGTA